MNPFWTLAGHLTQPLPTFSVADEGGTGLLCGCYGLFLLAYFALAAWVYSDANGRGNTKAGLWALLVFLTPLIGLIIYLLVGRDQAPGYPVDPWPSPTRWPPDDNSRRL